MEPREQERELRLLREQNHGLTKNFSLNKTKDSASKAHITNRHMKATVKKYKPPTDGYIIRLGFDEVITIKMALEDKLRKNMASRYKSKVARKEAKYTAKAMRGINQGEFYVY